MQEKSEKNGKDIPKELRMVNREYDEIVFDSNKSSREKGKEKPPKGSR